MALTPCVDCGGRSFRGTVLVTFYEVAIELPDDPDDFRDANWIDAPAEGDEVIIARCNNCGTKVFNPEQVD